MSKQVPRLSGLNYHVDRALLAGAQGDAARVHKHLDSLMRSGERDERAIVMATMLQAKLAQMRGERNESVAMFQQTLDLASGAIRKRMRAFINLNMSSELDDLRTALKVAEAALREFELDDDDMGVSNACLNLGTIHAELGQHAEGRRHLERALAIKRSLRDRLGEAIVALNLASQEIHQGRYDNGLKLGAQCVAQFEELLHVRKAECVTFVWQTGGWTGVPKDCTGLLVTALNNHGNVLAYLGDVEGAIVSYARAVELAKANGDLRAEGMVLNQIGDAHRELGDHALAERYFRESFAVLEQAAVVDAMSATVLQGIGEACLAQGRYSEAADALDAALARFVSVDNGEGAAEVTMLIGELNAAMGNGEAATDLLTRALERGTKVSAARIVVRCHRLLGAVKMNVDSRQAREHLRLALLPAEEHSMKTEQMHIHRELASYYKLVSDPVQALVHFERFHDLQRDIDSREAARQARNLEIRKQLDDHRRSIETLTERVHEVERELASKNQELRELVARLLENQKFLRLLEEGLSRMLSGESGRRDDVARQLLRTIRDAGSVEKDEQQVTRKFLDAHRGFAAKLSVEAPGIRQSELQVCVLLRLSMTAKQIAEVLHISPKTVFNHQGKVRKRLKLPSRANLKNYLLLLDAPGAE